MCVTKYRIKFHVIFNSIFWLGMYLFWLGFNRPAMPNLRIDILFTFVDFLCFSLLAILTAYVLIPRFLYRKMYFRFGLWYLLLLAGIPSLMVFFNFLILSPYRPNGQEFSFSLNLYDLAGSYLLAFFLSSTSCVFKIVDDFYISQSDVARLKEEKMKAELEFLKLQVNPHSFFNILNNIYFQIDFDKESAKNSVLKFSNMFRYQLYDCKSDTVCINNEIKFLKSYIEISATRFDADYKIDFNVQNDGNPMIAPFLLLPLVENSFKHVSQYANRQNSIAIFIKYNDSELECSINNTSEVSVTNEGIGLKNLKRRLELLYKGKYSFSWKYEDGQYKTQLKIIL